MIKRAFDFTAALAALVVLSPLFAALALIIRAGGGAVFFLQPRVGRAERPFRIIKFRTMVPDADKKGAAVTARDDPRITATGRFLRRTKLDELPQLINVLKGEMSLVGPRPEVPKYVEYWPPESRETVLSVRPGITDYATFTYSDEQAVLAGAKDVESEYVHRILPHKLELCTRYVNDRNFWLDIRILTATLLKMIGLKSRFLIPEIGDAAE